MILDAGSVILRPYENQGRAALQSILGDPGLMEFVLDEREFVGEEAGRFVDDHFVVLGGLGLETVCLKSTGEAIGFSGFRECRYLGEDDVGERLIVHALESWGLARVLAA